MEGKSSWPYCVALDCECIVHKAAGRIGQDLLSQFLTFVRASEEGSRLILQRNKEGFTAQVTGPVRRGIGEDLSKEDVELLRSEEA